MPRVRRGLAALTAFALPAAIAALGATTPASGQPASGQPASGQPAASHAAHDGRVTLPGTKPEFATSDNDQGEADAKTAFDLHVYFGVPDAKALTAQARAVSDPNSPSYRKYLTIDQVKAAYQITAAQRKAVDSWLAAAGLTATELNWRYLEVKGATPQLEQAFGVQFHNYDEDGGTQIGPNADLSVPAEVGGTVVDVSGYVQGSGPSDSRRGVRKTTEAPRHGGIAGMRFQPVTRRPTDAATCSTFWGEKPASTLPPANGLTQTYSPCPYSPTQLRALYGFDSSGLTGKGQRIAVLTPPSPTLVEDVTAWSAKAGLPALRKDQLTVMAAPDGSGVMQPGTPPNPAFQDNTMDVEAIRALAPDADVTAVALSFAANGLLADSVAMIEDKGLATIVNASLAEQVTQSDKALESQLYQQGALLGIGFVAATGDQASLNYPAGNPWVAAVGGTSVGMDVNGHRAFETGFADTGAAPNGNAWGQQQNLFEAGGGRDEDFPEPWYQAGAVPSAWAAGKDGKFKRVGADVAMDADRVTGMLVGGKAFDSTGIPTGNTPAARGGARPAKDGATYVETYGSGTSQAAPLFTAVQALAQQAAGVPIGFANPALYARAGGGELRDVTTCQDGAGRVPTTVVVGLRKDPLLVSVGGAAPGDAQMGNGPAARPGYDEVTGLGVPTPAYLASYRYRDRDQHRDRPRP